MNMELKVLMTDNQDGEEACVLYEVMKAGVQERFGLEDDDMNNILDEILY